MAATYLFLVDKYTRYTVLLNKCFVFFNFYDITCYARYKTRFHLRNVKTDSYYSSYNNYAICNKFEKTKIIGD